MKDSSKSSTIKGMIIALSGAACWGFSGCCGQYLMEDCGVTSGWIAPYRLLISGIVLLIIGFIKDRSGNVSLFKSARDTVRMLVFALLGVFVSQVFFLFAVQYSNAATSTVLQSLSTVMVLIVVCIGGKRLPIIPEVIAIVLAFAGTFFIGTHGNIGQLQLTPQGLFWGLMAGVGAMLYTCISGDLIRKYGVCQILGFSMFISGIAAYIMFRPWTMQVDITLGVCGGMFGMSVIGSAVAYSLFLYGVSIIGPVKGSLCQSLEPISSIIISAIWLGTRFHGMDILGFVLIILAVYILALKGKNNEVKGET